MTPEDRQNPTFYFHSDKIKYDLIYNGFNVLKLKLFIYDTKWVTKKGKDDKQDRIVLASESTVRKYKDGIIMGSLLRQEPLPSPFYDGMKHFFLTAI